MLQILLFAGIIALFCGKLSEAATSRFRAGWPWCVLFSFIAIGWFFFLSVTGIFLLLLRHASMNLFGWLAMGIWAVTLFVPFLLLRLMISKLELGATAPGSYYQPRAASGPILFACTHCHQQQQVPGDRRGRVIMCSVCRKPTKVPHDAPSVAPEAAPGNAS